MDRPLHRKLIGLAGLVAFFLGQPLAEMLHEVSGISNAVLTTMSWSLAARVIGYGFDGLGCARTTFVTVLVASAILHTVTPLGGWVQSVTLVLGTTLAYSVMTYFEREGLESP